MILCFSAPLIRCWCLLSVVSYLLTKHLMWLLNDRHHHHHHHHHQAQGQPSLVPTGLAIPGWKEFIYMHPTSGRSLLYLDEQTHQWSKKTPPGWLALASSVAQ